MVCVLLSTPDGKLRFFVEHWHNALDSPSDANTMQIREHLTGSPAESDTKWADGMFNGKDITTSLTGWGCIDDATPTMVKSCRNHENIPASVYRADDTINDW